MVVPVCYAMLWLCSVVWCGHGACGKSRAALGARRVACGVWCVVCGMVWCGGAV